MAKSYHNVNYALPALLDKMLKKGVDVQSRNGMTKELAMQQFTIANPGSPYITTPGRRVSLPAQIAETMWILAGRNDIGWLSRYLPRAKDFSDDGQTWRGGYGPRLRHWWVEEGEEIDQLQHIVNLLREDRTTRRAVFAIYDPAIDSDPGKDIPCNNWVHFLPRDGVLHAHVAIRSNDLFWGWSGINQFEWSILLSVVSELAGLRPGSVTFSVSSLHLYEHHWERARGILKAEKDAAATEFWRRSPHFSYPGRTVAQFDSLVEAWFKIEGQIRKGGISSALQHQIETFPEPLFRSWLFVLLAWTHDDLSFLAPYKGTRLYAAAAASPKLGSTPSRESVTVTVNTNGTKSILPSSMPEKERHFIEFVTRLHAEKHAAYGDSWMKRGEMLGIMANMARKIDRLGVEGGGDTAADTAIDLLVYGLKYRIWLDWMQRGSKIAGAEDTTRGDNHVQHVNGGMYTLPMFTKAEDTNPTEVLINHIRQEFEQLEQAVLKDEKSRGSIIDRIIFSTYPLAYRLWVNEQHEAWKKANETRSWNPEKGLEDDELEGAAK